jgi:hypothetical protein
MEEQMKEKSAAILTIKDPQRMDKKGRKMIAGWLRRQARHFEAKGDRYAKRFTARYLYN